ncbi:MAG: DUF6624 domain-containing protein [Bacteroidota bacterium]
MKKLLFCLLLSSFCSVAYSQSFTDYLAKGDKLYQEKDYFASAKAYDKTIELKPDISGVVYYNAACSWALAGEAEKALDRLEDAVNQGWTDVAWAKKDPDFNSIRKLDRWNTVMKKMQDKADIVEASLNKPLMEELRDIREKDQRYRMMMDSVNKAFGWESPQMQELWYKQNLLDSLNTERVLAIIEEHGYPGKTLVGGRLASTAFLVIQHADLDIQEKYLPMLKEAADKGELSKSSLALLIDRVEMRNGRPQIYGSQVQRNEETGAYEPAPIANPEQVDERRAEMGLGPLADYLSRWDIEWKGK